MKSVRPACKCWNSMIRSSMHRAQEPDSCPPSGSWTRCFPLLMDLDVATNQRTWPIRVAHSLDPKSVHRPGLAAVVDIDPERLRGRPGRPDDVGHPTEGSVFASRRAESAGHADIQDINGLNFYPYVHRMVVVLQVPGRRTALRYEAEGGLSAGVQTRNQSRQGQQIPER